MTIETDTELLQRDISRLQRNLAELERARVRVFAEMNNLNAMWEGPAHDTFVNGIAADAEIFGNLQKALQHMVECMEYAKTQYEGCSGAVMEVISKIM